MTDLPPPAPFLHLHVAKTAGSTLNAVLEAMFPGEIDGRDALVRRAGGEAALEAAILADPGFHGRYRALVGHFGVHHALVRHAPRSAVRLAVLRDPVARCVSFYDFIRATRGHPLHAEVAGRSLLQAFRECEVFRFQSVDMQLRQVFGVLHPLRIAEVLAAHRYCVGRFDRLPDYLAALEALAGRRAPDPIPHRNPTTPRAGVVPAREQPDHDLALEAIREASRWELEFLAGMPAVLFGGDLAAPG